MGWRRTYEVVDAETVVATDPRGAITYRYAIDDGRLRLDMADDQCVDGGVGELIAQTALYETAPFAAEVPEPASESAVSSAYVSASFAVPFEVTLPDWLPGAPTRSCERS